MNKKREYSLMLVYFVGKQKRWKTLYSSTNLGEVRKKHKTRKVLNGQSLEIYLYVGGVFDSAGYEN